MFAYLVIQLAMGMRSVVLSWACTTLQHFVTLSHTWHDSRKKITEHKMCVLIFSTTLET